MNCLTVPLSIQSLLFLAQGSLEKLHLYGWLFLRRNTVFLRIDPISGLVSLTVQFSDSTFSLIPGLSGTTMILVATKENSVTVPSTMMTLIENDVWEVFVLENGIPRKRHIVIGIRSGSRYEIIEGLVFGDTLINLGHTLVSDGCSVRVVL